MVAVQAPLGSSRHGPVRISPRWWSASSCSAHSRAAPAEITSLGEELRVAVHRAGRPAPALDALLSHR